MTTKDSSTKFARIALILAAGYGERIGKNGLPKQYRRLGGRPLLCHSLQCFLTHERIDAIRVVLNPSQRPLYEEALEHLQSQENLLDPVEGGATRQQSARAGLESLESLAPDVVLIHDAARPFVTHEDIDACLEALAHSKAVTPSIPLADSLKQYDDGVLRHTPRDSYRLALTPQGFNFADLLQAHRDLADSSFSDDAALIECAGIPVTSIEGRRDNFKITFVEDHLRAEIMLNSQAHPRTGFGYDVHRFTSGACIRLCGVDIPFEKSLAGHSDADVGLHALTDAVLGAVSAGDIGMHFPPSDPRWQNSDSGIFLKHAVHLADQEGFCIHHVDITLICEAPSLAPHRDAMREAVAGILNIDVSAVSIKATTTEGLGFLGRGEGIAAQAVANLSPKAVP
ncbi:MAG: bifunctional 2-C-methyl-D-erythritol 4-phosphate cytidylyltransferase/2-C-methyl-D-erythritol 2,4-cyclodiphosphate synthase [Hyphomicrobiales bacterium]|nr:bifunctional 2-C-methyl-D-erythritol 4-phosphate cytidylyltransferase/2-C-methyl-D-erythritol 2,4-cyclodiphosphate synthase [Hyphomicrobiales bacterium]